MNSPFAIQAEDDDKMLKILTSQDAFNNYCYKLLINMQQNLCFCLLFVFALCITLQRARLLEHIKNSGVTLPGKLTAEIQHAMKIVLKQWKNVQNADCKK